MGMDFKCKCRYPFKGVEATPGTKHSCPMCGTEYVVVRPRTKDDAAGEPQYKDVQIRPTGVVSK